MASHPNEVNFDDKKWTRRVDPMRMGTSYYSLGDLEWPSLPKRRLGSSIHQPTNYKMPSISNDPTEKPRFRRKCFNHLHLEPPTSSRSSLSDVSVSSCSHDFDHDVIEKFIGHTFATPDEVHLGDLSLCRESKRKLFIPGEITMSLLQWYRKYPYLHYTIRQKLDLMEKHKSEFPSKLRLVIEQVIDDNWLWRENPENAFSIIESNVRVFFLGRKVNGVVDISDSLNSQVDTEEEVELLMHFFGEEIDRSAHRLFYSCMLEMMSSEPQAHRFVPLYTMIRGMPYGGTRSKSGVPKAVLNLLAVANIDLEDPTSDSFVALNCLLGKLEEPINGENLKDMISRVLRAGKMDFSFMRLLIRKRPLLLKHCRDDYPLMHFIVQGIPDLWQWVNRDVLWQLYSVVADLGLHYYPKDLGFIFHGRNYSTSCALWGADRVRTMVSDKIRKALNHSCYPTMFYKAAINEDISPDGVYTLLRMDPAAAITPRLQQPQKNNALLHGSPCDPVAITTKLLRLVLNPTTEK